MVDDATDWQGTRVPADEPSDKEILVWEIEPHLQRHEHMVCHERSWQRMLDWVRSNIESHLERLDEEQPAKACSSGFVSLRHRSGSVATFLRESPDGTPFVAPPLADPARHAGGARDRERVL